jgi:hypothetical protein
MTTFTVPRDRLHTDLLPGDRITAIDGTPLRRVAVVEQSAVAVVTGGPPAVRLRNVLGTDTEWNLYPESQVESYVTVRRDDAVIEARAREAIEEMLDEQDGVLEGPPQAPSGPQAPEQPEPQAETPPRPKARRTRRFGPLLLISQGNGEWKTEDGEHGVTHQRAGYTFCEDAHPVRISTEMAAAARERPTHPWAVPIMEALRQGQRGYYCPGNQEHEGEWGWIPWSANATVDSDAHAVCGSLAEAGNALAAAMRQEGLL